MPTYEEVKAAENPFVEAAAAFLSFLQDIRSGERIDRAPEKRYARVSETDDAAW